MSTRVQAGRIKRKQLASGTKLKPYLCTSQNYLPGDEDQQDDLRLDHAVDQPGEELLRLSTFVHGNQSNDTYLRLVAAELPVAIRKTL